MGSGMPPSPSAVLPPARRCTHRFASIVPLTMLPRRGCTHATRLPTCVLLLPWWSSVMAPAPFPLARRPFISHGRRVPHRLGSTLPGICEFLLTNGLCIPVASLEQSVPSRTCADAGCLLQHCLRPFVSSCHVPKPAPRVYHMPARLLVTGAVLWSPAGRAAHATPALPGPQLVCGSGDSPAVSGCLSAGRLAPQHHPQPTRCTPPPTLNPHCTATPVLHLNRTCAAHPRLRMATLHPPTSAFSPSPGRLKACPTTPLVPERASPAALPHACRLRCL